MIALTDKFDNNLSNANLCNLFDNIPQILRVKASNHIIYHTPYSVLQNVVFHVIGGYAPYYRWRYAL